MVFLHFQETQPVKNQTCKAQSERLPSMQTLRLSAGAVRRIERAFLRCPHIRDRGLYAIKTSISRKCFEKSMQIIPSIRLI